MERRGPDAQLVLGQLERRGGPLADEVGAIAGLRDEAACSKSGVVRWASR